MLGKREMTTLIFSFLQPHISTSYLPPKEENQGKQPQLKIANACKLNLNSCYTLSTIFAISTYLVHLKLCYLLYIS